MSEGSRNPHIFDAGWPSDEPDWQDMLRSSAEIGILDAELYAEQEERAAVRYAAEGNMDEAQAALEHAAEYREIAALRRIALDAGIEAN
jgi:hypothetical protein